MNGNAQNGIVPVLERHEMKFVIPFIMIDPISDFVSAYCSLDKYSKKSDNGFYRVNNLYFDSPNYLFLKKRLDGSENRFNMRIRTYSDSCPLPCYFEIKQKNVNIIKKYRARINDGDWYLLFEKAGYYQEAASKRSGNSNRDLFVKMAYSYNAAPKVLTQYFRKAYVSDIDEYGRVTFDTDLRYQAEEKYNLVSHEDKMVPLDHEDIFEPGCSVVLELKCNPCMVPLWMVDLIRCFDLRRRSFSKYVTGVRNVLNCYSYDLSLRQTGFFTKILTCREEAL